MMSRVRTFVRGKKQAEINPEDTFLDASNVSGMNVQQFEGHIERPLSRYISTIGLFGLFFIFAGFTFRLYGMQVTNADAYIKKAEQNALKSVPIFAHRGTIEDRNGTLLAWNQDDTESEIPRRNYIQESGFAHLLGYVSYPRKDQSGVFWQDEYIGKDGVEKQYQYYLQGEKGEQLIEVSATHNIISENTTVDPVDGQNLKLTIDKDVQHQLYESIHDLAKNAGFHSGAGVIMDIHTGEILAIASYPEYNNNLMTNATSTEDKAEISRELNSPVSTFLNRAVGGVFTPGSTVKPFVALAALAEHIITPEKNIYSAGQLVIKNKYGGPDSIFRDWKAHGYVDMRKALAESSDEYFYQIGGGYMDQPGLGIDRLYSYMKKFGFEEETGVDLPGEVDGTIPSQDWKKKMFNGSTWLLGDTYHTAIGQYGFQTTPLELVRSVAMIANGGTLVTPHVTSIATTTERKVDLNPNDLKVVKEGMHEVLYNTAHALDIPGVTLAAKTGTAELGVNRDQVNSLVEGFFPYENPKYAFALVMERAPRANTLGAPLAMAEVFVYLRDHTNYTK